jgi:hypothetical protein
MDLDHRITSVQVQGMQWMPGERLLVMGPVLVTPRHFPVVVEPGSSHWLFAQVSSDAGPASCASTFAESGLARTYYLWPPPRDSAEWV